MFKLVMEDAKNMKNVVDAIVNLIDEGPMEVNENGILLRAIDPSQIAMIVMNMPNSAFTSYEIDSPTVIGINFSQLSKVLARSQPGDKLVLQGDESTLSVAFMGNKKKRTFKMPLLETRELIRKELSIDPESTVTVDAGDLKDSLKDVSLVSTYLTLLTDKDGLTIDVKGDNGNLKTEVPKESLKKLDIKSKARASFSLQYMESIVKACPDTGEVTLYIKTDTPLKTEYKIGDAHLVYFLAPRKEEYE